VVARLTKEIGLRMALEARRWSVLWLVFREMLTLNVVYLSISDAGRTG
jgi:hypothetical protein